MDLLVDFVTSVYLFLFLRIRNVLVFGLQSKIIS